MDPGSPLTIVERWREKTHELSRRSKDVLFSLFERTFETMALVLEPEPDRKQIQRSLVTLEVERKLSLEDDEGSEIPLREVSYGFVQSLQFVLQKRTKIRDQSEGLERGTLVEPNSPLEIVEEWRAKARDFSRQSKDVLFSLFDRSFETIALMLEKEPDYKRIRRSLVSMEAQRTISIQDDEEKELPLRDAIYGLVHCLYLTLQELTKIKEQPEVVDESARDLTMDNQGSSQAVFALINRLHFLPQTTQPIDTPTQPNSITEILDFLDNEVKNEETESIPEEAQNEDDSPPFLQAYFKTEDYTEYGGEEEEYCENNEETEKEEEKKENEQLPKKRKIKEKEWKTHYGSYTFKNTLQKKNSSSSYQKQEMQCPMCKNYQSRSVKAMYHHLRNTHGTTPSRIGIMFECDCGNKAPSDSHYIRHCKLRNFKIIHEKRIEEKRSVVKCILCESRLSAAMSYAEHLQKVHYSSLIKSGIHLLCSCGETIASRSAAYKHTKICAERDFSVQKS
ncbi:hypothetical protein PFISCL1PPCAC_21071 [Pristionchus fissidentatus]|uniref:C2H2-type domain-containing protein n=1 Tax=Pristionchus fissidentatus TaxID=1538716 RepID=A0AAV5WGB8_9BILA|nr:hypothetical protein PFISCL1PPCAC_21071 [Pristionchus fissidentatus]